MTERKTPDWLPKAKWMYADRQSTFKIGKALGVRAHVVLYYLKRAGVEMRRGRFCAQPDDQPAAIPKRPCMRCRRDFRPQHKFNRLCFACNKYAAHHSPMAI